MSDTQVEVGGEYVENPDHIPNATDMRAQFNTSGTGSHGKIEEVSDIFEVDKHKAAMEVQAALDPDNKSVPESRVILPNAVEDNDIAREQLAEVAAARLENKVVVGGPTPAEREAALEGEEGVLAAVEQDRTNAAANSSGQRTAGQHTGAAASTDDQSKTVGRGQSVTKGGDDEELKGQALEDALDERDLPHTGTADEKRARVAEHDENN